MVQIWKFHKYSDNSNLYPYSSYSQAPLGAKLLSDTELYEWEPLEFLLWYINIVTLLSTFRNIQHSGLVVHCIFTHVEELEQFSVAWILCILTTEFCRNFASK